MIGMITGTLIEKQPPSLVIACQGLGYEIEASMNTFYQLPEAGREITLYTHFVVREDAQLLFGFYERQERDMFRILIKTSGVGPKLAITILSSITPKEFVHYVMNNDTASLVKLPGVGKKTAERLIVEMRDRLKDWAEEGDVTTSTLVVEDRPSPNRIMQEAQSALVALGYKPAEATRAISHVFEEGLGCEDIIRLALKGIAA